MNDLLTFTNDRFGKIRALTIDGEPWMVGKDVARSLGYKDTVNALKSHVEADDKRGWRITTPSGEQEMTVINESGFYSLAFGSKMKEAKAFKRWVTHEVLPSIRKTGGYMTEQAKASLTDELRAIVRDELAKRPAPPAVAPNNLAVLIDSTRRIMKDMYCSAYEIAAMARDNYVAFGVPVPATLQKALEVEQATDDLFDSLANASRRITPEQSAKFLDWLEKHPLSF